jgi:DNA repair protein RecO (recombination protein O)
MIQSTKGIVLRGVKYGETSLIVTIYTELFGLQSYLVNGIRTSTKKGGSKANVFQPAALLDLVVYHNDLKNLQRIKEFKWGYLYQNLFYDVVKNSVALFMVELLLKTVKQPESHSDLYLFIEDAFVHLDRSSEAVVANYPLFFALHLASFLGLRLTEDYSPERSYLDLREGTFSAEQPRHPNFLAGTYSYITAQLLKSRQPLELEQIKLNQESRRVLIEAYQDFYALHIADFSPMKTLPVLQVVLSV